MKLATGAVVRRWVVLAIMACGLALAPAGAGEAVARRVTLSAPASAIEGERFTVAARIASPRKAKTVQFQILTEDVWGDRQWKKLRTVKAARKATRSITFLADEETSAKVRAVVTYRGVKRKTVSKPVSINFWHWYSSTSFRAYASAGSPANYDFLSFQLNGRPVTGWYAVGAGESRFTLGRNCSRFRGDLGLTDKSGDGATAVITLATIGSDNAPATIYTSPELRPGVTVPVNLRLPMPYRFAIEGHSTSVAGDGGIVPATYPAIGDAAFLCHFPDAD